MSIQDTFYLLGIVYMFLGIILMVIIGVILWSIKQKLTHLYDLIDEKVTLLTRYANDPTDTAINIGSKVATMAVRKMKESFNKRK